MPIYDINTYNLKKKKKIKLFFYLIDYVENHHNRYRYPKNLCCKRSYVPRNDRFLFVEQSVYKSNSIYKKSHAYTYSLFNVWPGVNADNRKSVGKSGEPVVTSFHVVDRFGSSEWKDGRVMYPVFARGMMEMI